MSPGATVHYRSVIADSARWEGFEFRPDDIVISTPPKCGTTWMQMICAVLILQTPVLDRPLDQISPWLDILARPIDDVRADLQAQTHRRFIKTHTPLDGLPLDDRVTYISVSRDPRDVALSWDGHLNNADATTFISLREATVGSEDLTELVGEVLLAGESERDRFWSWVEPPTVRTASVSGLEAMLHHLGTFWAERDRPNVVLVRYEDLLDDLGGQMREVAARLHIDVSEPVWPDLVRAATFVEMKARSGDLVPEGSHKGFYQDSKQFFRSGRSGQWRAVLTDEDLPRYEARVAECAPADLAAWIHRRDG